MGNYKSIFKEKKIILPDVGDILLVGKFKNKKVIVKGFDIDKNNQPIVITNKGKYSLFNFRIEKLMK